MPIRSALAVLVVVALVGCGSSDSSDTATPATTVTAAAPVEQQGIEITHPSDGARISASRVTLRGTGVPGDIVEHDGETATIAGDGTWSLRIPLERGEQDYEVEWTGVGTDGSEWVTIVRPGREAAPPADESSGTADPAATQNEAFQALDDAAIAGDAAMLAAIDAALGRGGEAAARSKLRSSYRKARRAVDPLLLEDDVEGLMVAGNEIASALRTAQDLLARGDARGIVRQRKNLRDARDALAAALVE